MWRMRIAAGQDGHHRLPCGKPHGGSRPRCVHEPWPSTGSHPLLWAEVLRGGGGQGQQCLTAPRFWQVPASSATASSCWSARIHPRPGPLPAACPRPPVSHPWPSPASSSWRSSRSGMRAKRPCQVSSPGPRPLPMDHLPEAWDKARSQPRPSSSSCPLCLPMCAKPAPP